jgi:hypothetical protein
MTVSDRKERTPEQIEAAKARMAAVRAKKSRAGARTEGSKPKADAFQVASEAQTMMDGSVNDAPSRKKPEHKRAAPVPDEFEGITGNPTRECCNSCYASGGKRCAITHREYCGHPLQSGLQHIDQMNPATVARYQIVKKRLAHAKVDAG